MPTALTDIFATTGGAVGAFLITAVVQILQRLSWVPLPTGSRAHAYAVALLAAGLVALASASTGNTFGAESFFGALLAWVGITTSAMGIQLAPTLIAKALGPNEKEVGP